MTFSEAKQQVAEKHKYPSWDSALRNLVYYGYLNTESPQGEALTKRDQGKFLEMEAEAAELYAQSAANEAVKADRQRLENRIVSTIPGNHAIAFLKNVFIDEPLPYPEANTRARNRKCIKCERTLPEEEFYETGNVSRSIRTDCKTCHSQIVMSREKRLRETDPSWVEKEKKRQVEKMKRYRKSKIK